MLSSLVCTADKIRDLYTKLGARPDQVFLVWTRWSGGERGIGTEQVACTIRLLPTPLVSDASYIRRETESAGVIEDGRVRVSEISLRYSEDLLIGRGGVVPNGESIPDDVDFFWEVFYMQEDGTGIRRRFTVGSAPNADQLNFEWSIFLNKAIDDRTRYGELQ